MSQLLIHAIQWVTPEILGPTQKAVLQGVADRARDDGSDAWPDIEELAHKASIHERTVQTTLRALEQAGWLTIAIQAGMPRRAPRYRPNEYQINVGKLRAALARTYERMASEGRAGRFPEILAPLRAGVAQDHPSISTGVAQDHPSGVASDHPHWNLSFGNSPSLSAPAVETPAGKPPRKAPAKPSQEVKERKRDELFEAVAEVCGLNWQELTKAERGKVNATVAQLREAGADAEEVRHRVTRGFPKLDHVRTRRPEEKRTFPSPLEIASHWTAMGRFAGPRLSLISEGSAGPRFRPCGRPVDTSEAPAFLAWMRTQEARSFLFDDPTNVALPEDEFLDAAWQKFHETEAVAL